MYQTAHPTAGCHARMPSMAQSDDIALAATTGRSRADAGEVALVVGATVAVLVHAGLVLRGMGQQPWVDEIQATVMALHPLVDQFAGHHMAGNWLHEWLTKLLHVTFRLEPLTAARTAGLVAWASVHALAIRTLRSVPGGQRRWLLLAGSSALLAWWTPDAKTYGWFAFWGLLAWQRTQGQADRARDWLILGLGPLLAHWGVVVPLAASLLIRPPQRLRTLLWALPGLATAAAEMAVFAAGDFLPLLRVGARPAASWAAEIYAVVRWMAGGGGGAWLGMAALLAAAAARRRRAVLVWVLVGVAQIGLHVALAGTAPVRYLAWWLPPIWLAAAQSPTRRAAPLLLLAALLQIGGLRAVAESPTRPGPGLDADAVAKALGAADAQRVLFDPTGVFGDAMLGFAAPITPIAQVLAPPHAAESCRWLRYPICREALLTADAPIDGNDPGLWLLIPDMAQTPRAGWFPWWIPPSRGPLGEGIPGRVAVRGAVLIPAAAVPAEQLQQWRQQPAASPMR